MHGGINYFVTTDIKRGSYMKAFSEIDFGYGDAANYKNNRRYKELFSKVFVKDEKLDTASVPLYILLGISRYAKVSSRY